MMNVSKQRLLHTAVELIYFLLLFFYIIVITPYVLDKFIIFESFMFKYMIVATMFFIFGLLLAMQHFLEAFSESTPYTYCNYSITRGVVTLFVYLFIFFNLILFEVLQASELLQIVFLLFSIYIGYSTLSSFKLSVSIGQ